VAALFSWAQSELILFFVNMGQDVSRLVESSGARLQDEKTSPGIAPTGSGSIQSEHPTSGASPTDAQLCPNCIYVHVEAPGPNGYFCGRWSKWVKSDNTCGEFERRPQAAHPA
jgi:hypothetical protein